MITITLYKYFVFTTKSKEYTQKSTQDAHVRERDPVSQKEKCSTRELELVGLITKELLVLGGWLHFVPSLGI